MFNHTGQIMLQASLMMANLTLYVNNDTANTLEQVKRGEDREAICYGELGCYSVNWPWTDDSRPVSNYPQHPDKVNPVFCLFTRHNPTHCQRLFHNDSDSVYRSFLVPAHKLYFIAHGFLEAGDKPWLKLLTLKLLQRSDCNVITVGWQGGSSPPYTQAVANIRLVGAITAHLINTLHRDVGVKTEYCHVIGHSLGAHLSGYIGNTLLTKFNLRLGRITGLDPAEPHFSQTDPVVRLDPTDAIYVDIVHTDARPFIQGGLGMDEPVGHMDFYPNGGSYQPGCDHTVMQYIKKEDGFVKGVQRFLNCDHVRSYEYFIESINTPCEFLAIECDSYENFKAGNCFKCKNELNPDGLVCATLGKHSVKTIKKMGAEQGILHPVSNRQLVKLYTLTGSKRPYCKSLYRITLTISSSKESLEHKGEIGVFSLEIQGIKGNTEVIPLFREQYYKPGSVHRQVVSAFQVERVRSGRVHWEHMTTLNVLTWRINRARIHLESIVVDNLEHDSSVVLCPAKDEVLYSGKAVDLRPCGINSTSSIKP